MTTDVSAADKQRAGFRSYFRTGGAGPVWVLNAAIVAFGITLHATLGHHISALDPGFSILVVLGGRGQLGDLELARGDTVLLPYAAGAVQLAGDLDLIRCRPPAAA